MSIFYRGRITASLLVTFLVIPTAQAASPLATTKASKPIEEPRLPPQCPRSTPMSDFDLAKQVKSHRRFKAPVIAYLQGDKPGSDWGFPVRFSVDVSGKVTCYSVDSFVTIEPPGLITVRLTKARRQAIARMAAAGYEPIIKEGKPVALSVSEDVNEEELPRELRALPEVPIESVLIEMTRAGCYADMCADYSVRIRGDGQVRFEGKNTHVKGVQEYRIAPADVRTLVQSLRDKDLWSLRPEYRSPRWKYKPISLRMEFGGQVHEIVDVSGEDAGMPAVVTQFEDEVDRVAATAMWTRLNLAGVEHLRASGFDFRSVEAQQMLSRVFFFGNADEDAVIRLFELGVPADSYRSFTSPDGQVMRISALEDAASAGMVKVVLALLSRGGHLTDGKVNQSRLDDAFRAAVREGRLASVKALWEAGGPQSRPALTFSSTSSGKPEIRHTILALHHNANDEEPWDGFEIVRWYVAQGQDVRVRDGDGANLLEIAIDVGDESMARYVLDRGVDPNLPGRYGRRPLDVAYTESMALILLNAGADIRLVEDGVADYIERAKRSKWHQVLDWVKTHSKG